MPSKPYKYHYYVKGSPAVLCGRPLSQVSRTTDSPVLVNCRACLADPFLAGREKMEPVPPKVRRDGATLILDFSEWEIASVFGDWMTTTGADAGWPHFSSWLSRKG